ncbi:uncharacterized protein E0L32_009759 [Thyridium curvatum]|uniref:Uncharacterized protein n=1 Tax=Thyridium curvatum TaxID=1093900 RepID=A0A507AV51_9PEZI|nr:uncharacterized protein E0L32_009759 [Thyridium curvatum]TPX08819.1 hypothetical protein E0L32_009759 [Thyridium curvatum]
MKISATAIIFAFAALASASTVDVEGVSGLRRDSLALDTRQNRNGGANNGRPVPTGACCVEATSLKQDVCNVNGQQGRCVPAGVNNCGTRLTCIEQNRLTCNPNQLERGRPLCRLRQGA